ncbi:MAG: hypothetical protein H0Z24_07440 [Thermosipho sp. (in: Bacteria)]|nr:hypothetical protein [Thermosipho sp. (in: thermotogales)]
MEKRFLAIDFGASSIKTVVAELMGERINILDLKKFRNEYFQSKGYYLWNVGYFLNVVSKIIEWAKDEYNVLSFGIDSWGVDFGIVFEDTPFLVFPLHYRNMFEHLDMVEDVVKDFGDGYLLFKKTGVFPHPYNTIFQIKLLKISTPDFFRQNFKILNIPQFLIYMLNGEKFSEYTMATTTQLYSITKRKWDDEILDYLKLNEENFGEINYPNGIIGSYKGMDIVNIPSHDTACAFCTLPFDDRDTLIISSGSWNVVGVKIQEPIVNKEAYEKEFSNEGTFEGKYRLVANIPGFWILEQILFELREQGGKIDYEKMIQLARNARINNRYLDLKDPELQSPGNIIDKIKSRIKEANLIGDVIKIALDSIVNEIYQVYQYFSNILKVKFKRLYLVGGGVKNELFCELLSRRLKLPVYIGFSESSAYGNIFSQIFINENMKNLSELKKFIRKSFEIKKID